MMGCNDIVIGYLIVDMCIGMNVIEVSRLREVIKPYVSHQLD
jgi:hypothetical protein